MMIRIFCALLATAIACSPTHAEQRGKGTRTDNRVRTLYYNPDEVYRIDAYTGYLVTVMFAPGEQVLDYRFGDSLSWGYSQTSANDGILFKPKTVPPQATNIVVHTDRRSYNFLVTGHRGGDPSRVGFFYRFSYPGEGRASPRQPGSIYAAFSTASHRNLGYSAAGSELLRPEQTFDDGRKTYIRLPQSRARPAVFALGANGRERLVNTTDLTDGTIVVSGVYPRLVLRDGDEYLCLFNEQLNPARKKTTLAQRDTR